MPALLHVRPRTRTLPLIALVVLVAAAVLANLGMSPTPRANAAATDSVLVTATIPSNLTVVDCGANMAIAVVLGGYDDASCAVTFGSSNDSSVTLLAAGSTATLFSSVFANEGGTCADLGGVDEAGLKIISVGANVSNQWGCTAGGVGTNNTLAHKGLTTTPANICQTSLVGTTHTCTFGIGVFEFGSDAAPSAPTATVNLSMIA